EWPHLGYRRGAPLRRRRREGVQFVLAGLDDTPTLLRHRVPRARKLVAERFAYDQSRLPAQLLAHLAHDRTFGVGELERLDVGAVEEGARVALAGVAEGPDPNAVRGGDRHLDRVFDTVLLSDVLDEADGVFDGANRVLLEAVRDRQIEQQL